MVYAKKSLGQNFLVSQKALADIISASDLKSTDVVLEAGPGKGALTELLLKTGAKVIAVEKDHELIPFLQNKFSKEISSGQLVLIENDILLFSPQDYKLQTINYKLIANIPYYITGQFFRKFLEEGPQPSLMTILVQKEVADRVVALDKKESILSISVKAYGKPRRVAIVKAGSFVPAPNVDSAILSITDISKKFFEEIPEKKFFEILKAGFAHKRKLLASNLTPLMAKFNFGIEKKRVVFEQGEIPKNARAENLTLENWRKLTKILAI